VLIDSHCHLNYLDDPDLRLAQAREAGVGAFLCIGVDEAGIDDVLALAERHDDVWASVGQHPDVSDAELDWLAPRLDHDAVVAVGETGLDYFHCKEPQQRSAQRDAFAAQLSLAARNDLPVIVHTREAETDTLRALRSEPEVIGVLHCFTESWDMARQALDLGYYISISGIVTFRNGENVRAVARRVPADRLLLETDAPWLAPVPHRGQRNEPKFLPATAEFLAALRGVSAEALARQTAANFFELFPRAQNSSSKSR
jgi:TatD DNase family protein